jgi:acyl-coenzyme A synthetase/AMP-(fatty) acid ligase
MGETITYSGIRVDLDDAEEALRSRDDVVDVVAVGVPDNYLGTALQLYVVLSEDAVPDNARRKSLLADVAERLDGVKPRALRFVTAIPHRANGTAARDIVAAVVMGDDVNPSGVDDPNAIDALRSAR